MLILVGLMDLIMIVQKDIIISGSCHLDNQG